MARAFARRRGERPQITQPQIFAAVALLAIANETISRAYGAVVAQGWAEAAIGGLGFSWALWVSSALAIALSLRAEAIAARRADLIVGAACLVLIALPSTRYLSAIAGTMIALWFLIRPGVPLRLRGASLILLAIAVNLLWTHIAMLVLAGPIEALDARLVGVITGSTVHENLVNFVRGPQGLLIGNGCTSVENASLALLLWIAIARSVRPQPRRGDWAIAAGIFLSVVIINVARLVLMDQDYATYRLGHGPVAATLLNLLVTASGLAWAIYDIRAELFGPILDGGPGVAGADGRLEASHGAKPWSGARAGIRRQPRPFPAAQRGAGRHGGCDTAGH